MALSSILTHPYPSRRPNANGTRRFAPVGYFLLDSTRVKCRLFDSESDSDGVETESPLDVLSQTVPPGAAPTNDNRSVLVP